MKTAIVIAALAITATAPAAMASRGQAYPSPDGANLATAQPVQGQAASPADRQPQPIGKSRAQVRQELIEALRAGTIPATKTDYPPSPATIELNRTRYAIAERYWSKTD
jgi:hypothetical protein